MRHCEIAFGTFFSPRYLFGMGIYLSLTCLPSLLHMPLTVLVGAMVTTGGVLDTAWAAEGAPRPGPDASGPRLGVPTGELWLVAGEETGDDSPLIEVGPVGKKRRTRVWFESMSRGQCEDKAVWLNSFFYLHSEKNRTYQTDEGHYQVLQPLK